MSSKSDFNFQVLRRRCFLVLVCLFCLSNHWSMGQGTIKPGDKLAIYGYRAPQETVCTAVETFRKTMEEAGWQLHIILTRNCIVQTPRQLASSLQGSAIWCVWRCNARQGFPRMLQMWWWRRIGLGDLQFARGTHTRLQSSGQANMCLKKPKVFFFKEHRWDWYGTSGSCRLQTGQAGDNVGVLLRSVKKETVQRGMVCLAQNCSFVAGGALFAFL